MLFNGAPDAILIADPDGIILEANQASQKLFNYSESEIETLNIKNLFHEQSFSTIQKGLSESTENNPRKYLELNAIQAHKKQIPVDVSITKIQIETQILTQLIVRDISDHKEKDDILYNLTSRLELSLDAGKIGCWSYNLNTDTLVWDSRMFEIYGVDQQKFTGRIKDFLELVHPEDRQLLLSPDAHKVNRKIIFRIIQPNGSQRYVKDMSKPMHNNLNQEVLVGINYDITDRVEYEGNLERANRELEQAKRLKDKFLANMSHEFRTPLNAISGFTELLQKDVYGELTPRQEATLKRIEKSANNLLILINDILDYAKIESGQMDLAKEKINIDELLAEIFTSMEVLAKEKHINMEYKVNSNSPIIYSDFKRLRQIMLNLIDNAIKFTPLDGLVLCQVSSIVIDNHEHIKFSVVDSGPGIPEFQFPLLFKPFTQLDNPLTRNTGGTGLGLAIVKQLVEKQGGIIEFESTVGKGSKFHVILPVRPISISIETKNIFQDAEIIRLNSQNKSTIKRILVVDDNEMNMMLMVDYLGSLGYECIEAKNGLEALQIALKENPDLILMDIQMPVMNGLEATKKIREIPQFNRTPIIAVTSFAMADDYERCIQAGANDYLSKPVPLKLLKQTISKYFDAKM